jgi:hypothetical protein
MTLVKVKGRGNRTVILQASLMIVTSNCQNIFIEQATGYCMPAYLSTAVVYICKMPMKLFPSEDVIKKIFFSPGLQSKKLECFPQ